MTISNQRRKDKHTRTIALFVFTGLVISLVRYGLEHHWKLFPSWELLLTSWLIHTLVLVVFTVIAATAIIRTHNFFLGSNWTEDKDELTFYIVMTVLIGALSIAVLANYSASKDDDANLIQRPQLSAT